MGNLNKDDLLTYEGSNSFLVAIGGWIPIPAFHEFVATRLARKIKRKYNRFVKFQNDAKRRGFI